MAIEINGLNNQAAQGTQSQVKVTRSEPNVQQQQTGRPASFDTVTLTETASQLRKLSAALGELPVTDPKRVEDIRRAIANGSFSTDSEAIADKILGFEDDRRDNADSNPDTHRR